MRLIPVIILFKFLGKSQLKLRVKLNINLKAFPMSLTSLNDLLVISTSEEFMLMDVFKQNETLHVMNSPLQFVQMIGTQNSLITFDGQLMVEWKVINVRKPQAKKAVCGMGCCSRCVLM